MQWICLTVAMLLQAMSSISLTLSTLKETSSARKKALWAVNGLLGTMLSYYLLALALKQLSLIRVFGLWSGAGAISSALVILLFYEQVWSWKRNLFLLFLVTGMLGLMFTG
jgi:quaternary ammonium compound-resistance protein SugE